MIKYAKQKKIEMRQAAKKGRVAALVLHSLFGKERVLFVVSKNENETQEIGRKNVCKA